MTEEQNWHNEATQLLTQFSSSSVRMYSTFDFGRQKNFGCISIIVPHNTANAILLNIRKNLQPGLIAFTGTTQWLGDEKHDGVELVIGTGDSQFDILRIAQSDAANYGMDTKDLIEKLQQYDRDFGINIVHAQTDTVGFEILNMPSNLLTFAEDIYKFCPDIVNQGCGSISNLIEIIDVTGQILLWWD